MISLRARSSFGSPDWRSLPCTLAMEVEDGIIYKCCSILKWLKECITFAPGCSADYYFLLKHNFWVLHLHGLQVSTLSFKDIKCSFIKLRELSTSSCASLLGLTEFLMVLGRVFAQITSCRVLMLSMLATTSLIWFGSEYSPMPVVLPFCDSWWKRS